MEIGELAPGVSKRRAMTEIATARRRRRQVLPCVSPKVTSHIPSVPAQRKVALVDLPLQAAPARGDAMELVLKGVVADELIDEHQHALSM
jgi:hypothetical protein